MCTITSYYPHNQDRVYLVTLTTAISRQQQNEKEAGRRRVREAREKLLQVKVKMMMTMMIIRAA